MADIVSPEKRSLMMAGIRGRDTGPELAIRRGLHRRGFRYRVNARELPGRPDLKLPRYNAVVFVHGCYWHRHPNCWFATTPSTRTAFWEQKFAANVARDARAVAELRARSWRVAIVWECAIRQHSDNTVELLARWLKAEDDPSIVLP